MTDQLFDPNDYKSRDDRAGGTRQRTSRTVTRNVKLEPIEQGWTILASSRGVSGFQHAIKAFIGNGSVRTHCDMVGRAFDTRVEHFVAERCAVCEDVSS